MLQSSSGLSTRRGIGALLIVGLLGCDVGGREVIPTRTDGAVNGPGPTADSGSRDGRLNITKPPPAKGDTTTCRFLNGTGMNSCYLAASGPAPQCSGVGSCTMDVAEPPGTELTWKSSCGGYAYSVIDGVPDTIGFECPGADDPMEQVTCVFVGSTEKQACTTSGLPGPFRCSGTGSCEVWVLTKAGTKLTWTSTCSGSHQTVVGGGDKTLSFACH